MLIESRDCFCLSLLHALTHTHTHSLSLSPAAHHLQEEEREVCIHESAVSVCGSLTLDSPASVPERHVPESTLLSSNRVTSGERGEERDDDDDGRGHADTPLPPSLLSLSSSKRRKKTLSGFFFSWRFKQAREKKAATRTRGRAGVVPLPVREQVDIANVSLH